LADFRKALGNLEQALSGAAKSDLEQAGCIQYFEFCFELAWKSIQAMARELGLSDCDSPKACLRQAFAHHWLDDEMLWLEILSDRNRMSHTYSAMDAGQVYNALDRYLPAFQSLLIALQTERDRWP
jgi:nucleotidyltransferase substrate binding protein (TIGR01987 family)